MNSPELSGMTADVMAKLRADLISEAQQRKLVEQQALWVAAIMSLEMTGDAAQVSQDVGMFQFLRGKYDAYQDLLTEHKEAAEQLAAGNANSNIAG